MSFPPPGIERIHDMATRPKRKPAKRRSASPKPAKRKSASRAPHPARFPGESGAYRKARNDLLKAEIALRRNVEAVAAQRRRLPLGGPVPEDYAFEEADDAGNVRRVRMSDLFKRGNILVVYSYMYGPAMAKPCPMCSSMLDSLDGSAKHAGQRVDLVVVAKSPIDRIRQFARERGWRNLRLLSSAGNSYNRDYHGENEQGAQMPMLNVFTRRNGKIHHTWGSELLFAPEDAGQNARHVDAIWPLWNLLDTTPEGRGDWYPKLEY
jgi:predicted dithiol-disulfide oxidoreductase (DUF899 family)